MSYISHTKNKLSDIINLLKPLKLGLTPHWGCCLSATLILLKSATQLGTLNRLEYRIKLVHFVVPHTEVIVINNDCIIKGKIEPTLGNVLKDILNKKKMTQQDLIDLKVKEFVIENLDLIVSKDTKGSK